MRKDTSGYVRISNQLLVLINQGKINPGECQHLLQVNDVQPSTEGCEDCLKTGDRWVHLRLCLACGHVGCCDESKNRHATRHYQSTGHPLIASYEPGEKWLWCYVDEIGWEGDFS